MRVIGLMSGTSLDGVDAAVVETDGEAVGARGKSLTLPYPAELRARLMTLINRAPLLAADDAELLAVTEALTRRHAEAAAALGVSAELIGFHGQTILHNPQTRRTWQIGDAALLARLTGLPVAYDFRSADVAAGGQGAPLVPAYHAALAAGLARPLAILNLGGVGNITFLPEDGPPVACDTGPGNALLDDYCLARLGEPMDRDGALARAGTPDEASLASLLAHPFFARPAPKSLDRQDFAGALSVVAGLRAEDAAATLAAFTARAAARAPLPKTPRRLLVCGGGRHNPAIMAALAAAFPCPVEKVEAVGWDGDALEAECFAFLAARVRRGLPLSYPRTTGVPRPLPGGRMVTV